MMGFVRRGIDWPVSVDGRVEPFIDTAKQIIRTCSYHSPTWVIGTKKSVAVIQSKFEDKVTATNFIKKKLTEMNAEFFIFIHEAYYLKLKREQFHKFNPYQPVKEHEGSIDCLMVIYQTREGFSKMWSFPIIQTKGKRDLGKPDISDNRQGKNFQIGQMVIDGW